MLTSSAFMPDRRLTTSITKLSDAQAFFQLFLKISQLILILLLLFIFHIFSLIPSFNMYTVIYHLWRNYFYEPGLK